jgi:hypothetical protein
MTRHSIRRLALRPAAVLAAGVVLGSLTVAPASAASTVGTTFTPVSTCTPGYTLVQSPNPAGASYSTPAGVVTAWRFQASSAPPALKLKVFRSAGGAAFTVVGSSAEVTPAASTLSSFAVRIPVRAGDVIGLAVMTMGPCLNTTGNLQYVAGDAAVGSTQTYSSGAGTLDVAATVEPDADGDGYGDETQDGCPAQASTQGPCALPDTTAPTSRFTAGPTRTTKHKATFSFTSDDPGARFECRITGKRVRTIEESTFQPCASPKKFKHLRPGKYQVSVRATDAAGNVEAVPPTVTLKVQKKR